MNSYLHETHQFTLFEKQTSINFILVLNYCIFLLLRAVRQIATICTSTMPTLLRNAFITFTLYWGHWILGESFLLLYFLKLLLISGNYWLKFYKNDRVTTSAMFSCVTFQVNSTEDTNKEISLTRFQGCSENMVQ